MILQDLGGGLVIRRATARDTEALIAFNGEIHADAGIAAWTRDMMEGRHPAVGPEDFTVVEDTRTGAIVSSLCLISQTWSYDGIAFPLGQIEAVATDPAHRRRGLVRKQFEIVHEWSRMRGELVQAISGIPWYYRQFGYELALELGGGRAVYPQDFPPPEENELQSVRLRPVMADDLPILEQLDARGRRRSLVACVRDARLWRFELEGCSERNIHRHELTMLETPAGETLGFIACAPRVRSATLAINCFELAPGLSYLRLGEEVLRSLLSLPYHDAAGQPPIERMILRLGSDHPAYHALANRLTQTLRPNAWYLRVADLPGFLRHVAPALEARLAASQAAGFSGELTLNFYRDGLRLVFEAGQLAAVHTCPAPDARRASASFPDLTFLQVLFGYRSLADLEYAFADCRVNGDANHIVLDALFPRRSSFVWQAA